ncbi:hypothetical protein FJTKL_10002 [Diaporthe vaccinii]|uniref:Uncharacterized protein n=1 Tax=Diaporthe vaccinii TaxID=105482 RepID=A0ABR4EM91_9PEZI
MTIRRDRFDTMQRTRKRPHPFYFRGMKREECVAPIPGRPCLTGRLKGVDDSPRNGNVLRDRELSQVVADHLRLDLNLVELLSGVDADDAADHLGNDQHVTQVSLDDVGLLVGLGLLLRLAELLDEAHGLALQTTVDPSAGAGVDDIAELVGREIEEPVIRGVVLAIRPSSRACWSSLSHVLGRGDGCRDDNILSFALFFPSFLHRSRGV